LKSTQRFSFSPPPRAHPSVPHLRLFRASLGARWPAWEAEPRCRALAGPAWPRAGEVPPGRSPPPPFKRRARPSLPNPSPPPPFRRRHLHCSLPSAIDPSSQFLACATFSCLLLSIETHRRAATGNTRSREASGTAGGPRSLGQRPSDLAHTLAWSC
jgi:hypothetical protein